MAAVAEGKGKESDPSFTADLMGWMCERCGNISIGNEWICSDPYVQRDHAEDPFDAFTRPTTNQSLLYFVQMMKAITGTEWAGKIPSDLPIYNIGGDQDPVGEYGKGIYEVTNWLVDTGHTVKLVFILVTAMRFIIMMKSKMRWKLVLFLLWIRF